MANADPLAPRTVGDIESAVLFTDTFDHTRVTDVRHIVTSRVEGVGLHGQRRDDFVLAVNELITNAVRHGGGRGWLRLWREGMTLFCVVADHGPGIDAERLADGQRPAPDTAGGWGLWLARELSDEMVVHTGPTGTSVRISAALGRIAPAAQPNSALTDSP